jgi:hypothetical protein
VRVSKGFLLIILTFLSFALALPPRETGPSQPTSTISAGDSGMGSNGQTPRFAGADPVPNLSLPRTVLSGFDDFMGSGGVIQANKLALAGQQLGVPVRYYFYGGVSEPFKEVLRSLGIGWWPP